MRADSMSLGRRQRKEAPTGRLADVALASLSEVERPTDPCPDASWRGWGDPAQVPVLPEAVRTLLARALGIREGGGSAVVGHRVGSPSDLRLPASRLEKATESQLAGVVGQAHVLRDGEARVRHSTGKSTSDLLRLRRGEVRGAPDLVVMPGSHEQVLSVLEICSRRHIAVVPFGGGTSVVGALSPQRERFAGLVALDMRRMNALLDLDRVARLGVLEPGLRGPQAEALVGKRGFTIGHFPQSFEYATLGGFAAARSSGQASSGYGRFDELVMALRVAAPTGTLSLGRAPRSAAGPDLRQLILGSEGALGVITSLTLKLRPLPETRVYEAWRFPSFRDGAVVVRELAQDGPLPSVLRLSDEAETALNLYEPEDMGEPGALAVVGFEGRLEEVGKIQRAVGRALQRAGAERDPRGGESWLRDRYRGPYLRDALLDAGALVETLETACFWSGLERLYEAVAAALRQSLTDQGTPPVILCHISHVYRSGASLYFTVACAQRDDPIAQWADAKAAATDAIVAAGGSISHHHGVGTEHRPWYADEVGELGVRIVRAVKTELDPAGILNPGVLIGET